MTFEEWWDGIEEIGTPDTYRGWEETCRRSWEAGRTAIYGAEAEQITRPLKENIAILRDSAKDVLAWADGMEMEPYSFARLRAAIAVTETPNAKVRGGSDSDRPA